MQSLKEKEIIGNAYSVFLSKLRWLVDLIDSCYFNSNDISGRIGGGET